ncbi:MAG: hypothetical protein HYV95_03985 [Opitutae bacterium]|nr:hypothetical protein [Opitutae bacterium]
MNADYVGLLGFGTSAAVSLALYVRPALHRWWTARWCFTLLLTLSLFIFQRSAIGANFQLWNPDESQMLAGALTLQQRPVFWLDVDGTTHGPFNQWPLVLPALFGARIDYTSARVVATVLAVLMLACLQTALARRLREGTARLLVLPAWTLFIFNQDPETAQYTSELMPSLLLALAVALWPRATDPAASSAWCWAAGAAAGATPLAKLQAAPLAAWFLLFTLLMIWRAPSATAGRARKTGLLALGALSPVLGFAGHAAAHGAFQDFRIRYLESNLFGYAAAGEQFFNNARPTPDMIFGFSKFLWPVVVAILLGATLAALRRLRPAWPDLVLALGLVAAAVCAIYSPQKPFAHYFLLLVGPLTLLLGALVGPVLEPRPAARPTHWRTLAAGALLVASCGFTLGHHFRHPDYFRLILRTRPPVARDLVEAVQHRVAPGGTLAVWGWQPALYVMTQAVAATPDLIIFWQIVPSRWQEFYQARYLRDITQRPPEVFVDTMGPADFFFFRNPGATRHENFPALAEFIRTRYVLAETVHGARIYLRRDRAAPDVAAR